MLAPFHMVPISAVMIISTDDDDDDLNNRAKCIKQQACGADLFGVT
jgi:hypothetical protein